MMKGELDKILIFFKLGILISVLAIIFLIGILIDSTVDRNTCRDEFAKLYSQPVNGAFANDDFWQLNFGQNIDCSVFWIEDGRMALVDFKSGDLTEANILNEIYWKDVRTTIELSY